MRWWVFLAGTVLSAAVHGQPCTAPTFFAPFSPPVGIVKPPYLDPPPPGYVRRGLLSGFLVPLLQYSMGKFFLNVREQWVDPQGLGDPYTVEYSVVSDDGSNWRVVTLARQGWSVVLLHEWVFSWRNILFAPSVLGLMRSHDGEHWELAVAGLDVENEPSWTGSFLVAVGRFGQVFTTQNGERWSYAAQVPGVTRPVKGVANPARLLVDGSRQRGVTEDYQNWYMEYGEPMFGAAWRYFNGWFWSSLKSKDGVHYQEYPKPPSGYPLPSDQGGLKHFVWFGKQIPDDPKAVRGFYTEFVGSSREWGDYEPLRTMPWRLEFDRAGRTGWMYWSSSAFDGLRYYAVVAKPPAPPEPFNDAMVPWNDLRLMAFSCADFGTPQVLPGVAHSDGAAGSRWRTELFLQYPGHSSSEVIIQWLPFGQPNPQPREVRLNMEMGETRVFRDAVWELFGATGAGSLRVGSKGFMVLAHARTYNETVAGSLGQEIAPWLWEDGLAKGEEGLLLGLEDSGNLREGFRTNVGVQNLWVEPVVVEVVFLDSMGKELGRKRAELGAFEGLQWFRPLLEMGKAPQEGASALVRLVSGDEGKVAAWASRVDNRSGDASTMRMLKIPAQELYPRGQP
ncbi:MAG: hypothetical protein ACP5NF_08690 [Thermoanaerobaculum sp.]